MDIQEFKAFVESPPPSAVMVVAKYRDAIASRQAVERRTVEAQRALVEAQRVVENLKQEYQRTLGVEQGLQLALQAMMPVGLAELPAEELP